MVRFLMAPIQWWNGVVELIMAWDEILLHFFRYRDNKGGLKTGSESCQSMYRGKRIVNGASIYITMT